MKTIWAIVLIGLVIIAGMARCAVHNEFQAELYRATAYYVHGEDQISYNALVKENRIVWIKVRPSRKKARALFKERLQRAHEKYDWLIF